MTKKCSKCEVEQSLDCFYKDTSKKDGKCSACKECLKAVVNKEAKAKYARAYNKANKEKRAKYAKAYNKANKEKRAKYAKAYNKANKAAISKQKKAYRKENRKALSESHRVYQNKRISEDPAFRLISNMRRHMVKILKGTSQHAPTLELLGCTPEHYKHHLEAQFTDGMNWDNYGEWHQDHIQAVSLFDMEDPEQQKICWHYTNYQPMWADQNIRKSNKVVAEYQVNLL